MCIYVFQVCIREAIERDEEWDEDTEGVVTEDALGINPYESFSLTRTNGETEESARSKAYQLAQAIHEKWPEYEPRLRIQQVFCQCAGPSYVEEEWMFSEGPEFARKKHREPQVGKTIRSRVIKRKSEERAKNDQA